MVLWFNCAPIPRTLLGRSPWRNWIARRFPEPKAPGSNPGGDGRVNDCQLMFEKSSRQGAVGFSPRGSPNGADPSVVPSPPILPTIPAATAIAEFGRADTAHQQPSWRAMPSLRDFQSLLTFPSPGRYASSVPRDSLFMTLGAQYGQPRAPEDFARSYTGLYVSMSNCHGHTSKPVSETRRCTMNSHAWR